VLDERIFKNNIKDTSVKIYIESMAKMLGKVPTSHVEKMLKNSQKKEIRKSLN